MNRIFLKTSAECHAAISAGNYAAADTLLAELRSEVEAAWSSATREQRQTIAEEVLELLAWARRTTLAKRSHTQRRLREIDRHSAYAPAPRSRRVEFDG